MNIPKPVHTPVGGAVVGSAAATVVFYLIGLWPAYAHMPGQVQGALQILATAALTALGGWAKLVFTPGQKVTLSLTPSPLPTVQPAEPVPAAPAAP